MSHSEINDNKNNLKYIYDQPIDECVPCEQSLWVAVITQALMDVSSKSKKREALKDKAAAYAWLTEGSEDFDAVCDMAGLDPLYVMVSAERAMRRGCQWRLPSGQGWRTKARQQTILAANLAWEGA